jgi:hypothetical protein
MDDELASIRELTGLAQDVRGIGLDKVQFLSMPFQTYEPDHYQLAPAPLAETLWQRLRDDLVLGPRLTSGATKASEAKPTKPNKPGKPGGSASVSPRPSAEEAAVGLCG